MAEPTQPGTRGHGGAGPHTQRQRGPREPVHQEGSEHSQLPPPGYLIDSSNHPRWVDMLKSNQSLREPVAEACHCYHGNGNLAGPEVHLGPSPALWGWGHLEPDLGDTSPSPQREVRDRSGGWGG